MKRFNMFGLIALGLVVAGSAFALQQGEKPAAKPADAKPADQPAGMPSGEYGVDAVHSSVVFRIKHMEVSNFYGRFNEMEGTYTLDPDVAKCAIDMTVKAESVDTANEARDKHLRSEEYFDTAKYPTITFKSKSFKKTGDNRYEVAGDLTLRGVTKSITVPFEFTGAGKGMRGEERSGFEVIFDIKRTDYGMTAMVGPLSDEVRLIVAVEGVKKK